MRKIILIVVIIILFLIGIVITNGENTLYTEIGGVNYAIVVDGEVSNSFPSGNYKVDVQCDNADACWNAISDKLILTNISGIISCDIEFNSIINTDYLNTYLTNLSGTTQGDGKVIHEIGSGGDYTNANVVKSFGTTPSFFRNTGSSSTTQTQVDSYWTFDSSTGVFTSDPSKMTTSRNYYHAYAKVPEDGYYQMCYTIARASSSSNSLYTIKTFGYNKIIIHFDASISAQVGETCYDMGYYDSSEYFNISEYGYSGTGSPVISFRIEKGVSKSIDTGYRYEGKNPNNYIKFNDELWRIIGVFSTEYDSNNDGTIDETTDLVKIIRNNSLGGNVWNNTTVNDWPNSSLYHLLNEQYYDWNTYKNSVSSYCYATPSIPGMCDYSVDGIKSEYRGMIVKAKWYLGGGGKQEYNIFLPDNVYRYERNSNAIYNGRSASTLGYIGLMYESDFLYGALESNCARTNLHGMYNGSGCTEIDWLYTIGSEWTISTSSANQYTVFYLDHNGDVESMDVNTSYDFRPVLYLSSSVYKVSGTGTITDPYIIGMAS